MFYCYLVLSAVLIPVSDLFFPVLREPYSWWLVPVLFLAFFAALVLLHLAVLLVSVAVVRLDRPAERGARYYRRLADLSIPLLMKLARVSVHTVGAEKVPENTRVLLVCNHQHDLDPVMLLAAFPELELGFIGKKEIYTEMPLVARIMHKLFCLPIDRENNREAAKTVIEAIKLLKADKASIGLFPEGYTSKTCELLPLRSGSLKIAYKAEVPIVVCVLNNTRSIPKRLFWRHTEIEIRVLSVLEPEQFKAVTTVELGNQISEQMREALTQMRGKA